MNYFHLYDRYSIFYDLHNLEIRFLCIFSGLFLMIYHILLHLKV